MGVVKEVVRMGSEGEIDWVNGFEEINGWFKGYFIKVVFRDLNGQF